MVGLYLKEDQPLDADATEIPTPPELMEPCVGNYFYTGPLVQPGNALGQGENIISCTSLPVQFNKEPTMTEQLQPNEARHTPKPWQAIAAQIIVARLIEMGYVEKSDSNISSLTGIVTTIIVDEIRVLSRPIEPTKKPALITEQPNEAKHPQHERVRLAAHSMAKALKRLLHNLATDKPILAASSWGHDSLREFGEATDCERRPTIKAATTQPKRLKLHETAMQVIPEWMSEWGVMFRDEPNLRPAALRSLDLRFKLAFEPDEDSRAALLAACEEAVEELERLKDVADAAEGWVEQDVIDACRAAIA